MMAKKEDIQCAEKESGGPLDILRFGASGGIGQSLVRAFREGNRLIGTYCRGDAAKLEPGASDRPVDVTDSRQTAAFLADVMPGLTRPVLIYTIGVSPNRMMHKMTDDDWDHALAINLTGAMRACRGVLPRMREVGFGRIILVSSVLARISVPGTAGYSAAKAGLCALSRVIAVENAKKGVTANTLALGYYNVGIIRDVPEAYLNDHVLPSIPQCALGTPENIAAAVRFIVDADYLTGATLDINGGIISG